jgi:hypothetical protein
MGRITLMLVVGALAACSSQPHAVSQAPPGVSYRFQGDDIASANQRANQYCQQYGKQSRLQSVNQSGSDNIAVYDCL